MKKKLALSIIFLLVISIPAYAFFNSDVKKAWEFIQAGMYPQAIELLNKRINDKPTDAEAHFLLGTCYFHQGDMGMADQRFESAEKLEQKYGSEVASEFQKAGNVNLDQGNVSRAQYLYSKAIQYNSGLRGQIAQGCFDRAAASMSKPLFDIAVNLDPSYKMKAYNFIMDKADAATNETCLKLYEMAGGYCGKECERGKTAGDRLLSFAKKIESANRTDKRIMVYKQVAAKFIQVPPDYELVTDFTGIKITDGKPSKFYKLQGNHFEFNIQETNWYIETWSGRKITSEEINKPGRTYLGGEAFRIVPTSNGIIHMGIKVTD